MGKQVKFTFRLVGVPPDQGMKTIAFDEDLTIRQLRDVLIVSYRLGLIPAVRCYVHEQMLDASQPWKNLHLDPTKDVIVFKASQFYSQIDG